MTKERAKKILDAIDDDRFQPIRESKRAGKKFVPGGPNVILTKKTKPGFWCSSRGCSRIGKNT